MCFCLVDVMLWIFHEIRPIGFSGGY